MKITTNCLTCGIDIVIHPSRVKYGRGKYCSNKCKRLSPESKKKISKALTGRKLSKETKRRMSESGKKNQIGKENNNWKGGSKTSNGYVFALRYDHPFSGKDGYILRSRIVVEEKLNRYLKPREVVHHVGERNDDRPHMLMAFSSTSAHRRFHGNPENVKPSEIVFDGRHTQSVPFKK